MDTKKLITLIIVAVFIVSIQILTVAVDSKDNTINTTVDTENINNKNSLAFSTKK